MRRPPTEWDEEYVLSLPREDDTFERKGSKLLDITLEGVGEGDVRDELAKQLSAFANTGGGQVIYGVSDRGEVDLGGVALFAKGRHSTKDWLEDLIPVLTEFEVVGVNVYEIGARGARSRIAPGKALYVVDIPDSDRAPHQSKRDRRYYVRLGGRSQPAPHKLIEDIRNRQVHPRVDLAEAKLAIATAKRTSSGNTRCTLSAGLKLRVANYGRVKASDVCVLTAIAHASLHAANPEAVDVRAGARPGELIWELRHPVYPGLSVPLNISMGAGAEYKVVEGGLELVLPHAQNLSPDELKLSWSIFADSAPPKSGVVRMGDLGLCQLALRNFSGP